MKKLFLIGCSLFILFNSFSQLSDTTFNYTGAIQTWVVPICVTQVNVTIAGAQGGTVGGAQGGQGAVITAVVNVTPGDVITMNVGEAGSCPGAGYNGGGIGFNSNNGNPLHASCGGGGSTNTTGFLIAIAAGGGGGGGGSVNTNGGGDGGCANGLPGGNTFGDGGFGGTQFAGGAPGAPWAGTIGAPDPTAGTLGAGGNGGFWNTASGGGGGGGYYGGGGGGHDGCCTGGNGGGGGGGGSSLVPAIAGCAAGSNVGDGYVFISWPCENIDPTASNPTAINIECIEDVPVPDINVVTDELDNCDPNPVVAFVSDASDGNTCPEIITRTYSVTDSCLNQILVTQTITIQDITLPTASNPLAVNIICIEDLPAVDLTVVTDELDNCVAPIIVAHVSDVSDGNTCPEVITRTYSVTDDCGNTINVMQTITINNIAPPTASNPAAVTISCLSDLPAPDPNVVIDEADNCLAPITVSWVSDQSNGNSCNSEIIIRTYSVTDACGNSINVTQEIFIDAFIPFVDAGLDQAVCENVQVHLTAANPDGAAISWNLGVIDDVDFLSPIGSTKYTVTADICSGECISTDSVNVTVNLLPVIEFVGDSLLGCDPFTTVFTNLSTEQYDCLWNFGDGSIVNSCGPVSNTYNYPGIYDVTLIITSSAGCISTDTYIDYVEVIAMPEARFNASTVIADFDNTNIDFTNTSLHSVDYYWTFGDSTSSSTLFSPSHAFPDEHEDLYLVTLTAFNSLGCSHSVSLSIFIEDVLLFYVPNSFTPDGDEYNETFTPVFTEGFDIYDYHLTIFNRWGEIMFESYNSLNGWRGQYGSGGLVDDGTYIWQIEFSETGVDKKHEKRGHVTVLK